MITPQRYGPWAVVTGASSGIGREVAVELAAAGLSLVLVARREGELAQLAGTLPVETLVIPLDLADAGAPASLLARTAALPVGLLVNAAGFGSGGAFLETDAVAESQMVDVNCRAVLELTHGFARRFAAQRRGGIVLFSSIVATQGVPRSANYAATKAYVHSLAEALAEELAPHGVDVLASAPGPTESGFARRAGMTMANAESRARVARETLAALGRRRLVVPGGLAKLLTASLAVTPRFLRVQIMKQVMKSMT
jgi:hypothetical protein